MPNAELMEDWERIRSFLKAAIASVPSTSNEALQLLAACEFELALEAIIEDAKRHTPGPAFDVCMDQAAALMKLPVKPKALTIAMLKADIEKQIERIDQQKYGFTAEEANYQAGEASVLHGILSQIKEAERRVQ